MHPEMYKRSVVAISPASVASTATAGRDIDTRGGKFTQIALVLPTYTANLATLKVQAGDTTSTYADVVPLTGGTAVGSAAGFVIPGFNSSDPTVVLFTVNRNNVPQRYLRLQVTPAAATVVAAYADVRQNEDDILTTTQQNVSAHVVY